MYWLWWCLWSILLFSVKIKAYNCPKYEACGGCHSNPGGFYEIYCQASARTVFKVLIQPGKIVKLTCPVLRPTNWTSFNLGTPKPIEGIKTLAFAHCDLPGDENLGKIARLLLHENVEKLDFQSYKNIGSNLTRQHLSGFNNIKDLTISNNKLSELPDDLLQDFLNLTLLNLRENNLRRLPENFLRSSNLQILELGINKLEQLSVNTFDKVDRIYLLNLWNNKLVKILPNTFDKLVSLRTLDIHRNLLESLPFNIFSSLVELKIINLSQNNFTKDSLPADLLVNNTRLETFSMIENRRNITTLSKGFFANLTKLTTIKLKKTGITWLPEDLLWGTINLRSLSLDRNYLITLPNKIFRDTRNLLSLNLNFNDLQTLPDDVFSSLEKLIQLDLSMNHITSISEKLFTGLSSLRELNMEKNEMTSIHFEAFNYLQNLHIAKFANNLLTLRSNFEIIGEKQIVLVSPFQPCHRLEELYLGHNNIMDVFEDWKYTIPTLKILNLSYNRLQSLEASDLEYFSANIDNPVNVDFTFNNISHIDLQNAEISSTIFKGNSIISIDNNPIQCDCRLYDLLRYLEGRMQPKVEKAFRLKAQKLKCEGPDNYRGIAVSNFRSTTLQCDANSLGEKIYCPDKCDCYVRPENKAFVADCAYKNLTETPKKLESPADHHIELTLSGNFLHSMPNLELPGYEKITVLSVDHNNISSVTLNSLSNNLQVLNLNDNNLTRLPQEVTDFFENSSLKNLTLQSNPWICDCESRDLLKMIQSKSRKISSLLSVTCQDQEKPISELTPAEICPLNIQWFIWSCLGISLLGLILGLVCALYYRYQRHIKIWLYSRKLCLWWVTESELDKDKLYDAFISYSHKDEDFVLKNLVTKLEEGPKPLKLCIHFRDWLAGDFIPNQIVRSVVQSRRTIVVLSPNFLESIWGRLEFRAAHRRAINEGRARVIVVLFGDIGSTDNLDSELQDYLRSNTYVKWGDPWFWEKLKYALPHCSQFVDKKTFNKTSEETIHCAETGIIDSPLSPIFLTIPMLPIDDNPGQWKYNDHFFAGNFVIVNNNNNNNNYSNSNNNNSIVSSDFETTESNYEEYTLDDITEHL